MKAAKKLLNEITVAALNVTGEVFSTLKAKEAEIRDKMEKMVSSYGKDAEKKQTKSESKTPSKK